MSKSKAKTVKIWEISHPNYGYGYGYWALNPSDFLGDLESMESDEDGFMIKCRELTKAEYNKLVKNSPEFDGW